MQNATGLTWEQLGKAIIDKKTILPDYLQGKRPEDLGPEGNKGIIFIGIRPGLLNCQGIIDEVRKQSLGRKIRSQAGAWEREKKNRPEACANKA